MSAPARRACKQSVTREDLAKLQRVLLAAKSAQSPAAFRVVSCPGYVPQKRKRGEERTARLRVDGADAPPLGESVAPVLSTGKRPHQTSEFAGVRTVAQRKAPRHAKPPQPDSRRHRDNPRDLPWAEKRLCQVKHFLLYVMANNSQWGGVRGPLTL